LHWPGSPGSPGATQSVRRNRRKKSKIKKIVCRVPVVALGTVVSSGCESPTGGWMGDGCHDGEAGREESNEIARLHDMSLVDKAVELVGLELDRAWRSVFWCWVLATALRRVEPGSRDMCTWVGSCYLVGGRGGAEGGGVCNGAWHVLGG
jgi:hypothetical protein